MKLTKKQAPNQLAAIPLEPNTMVEKYRIVKVLGIGGFSIVYSAIDTVTNNVVAVKEFYATNCMRRCRDGTLAAHPPEFEHKYKIGIKRFFDEGFILSQIEHPNIVKVSNFFRENNTAYLVMDFQRGKDLRWFIKSTDIVPDEVFLLSVFSMALAGLKEIHRKGFLHLDIKPSNILLRASGHPLILDLGASFRIKRDKIPDILTLTHGYSSPEQHERTQLSECSDLYSVAMTMRACITHETPQSAAKRIKKDQIKPLTKTHSKHYRPALLETIDAASSMAPGNRPQSVDEFVEGIIQR